MQRFSYASRVPAPAEVVFEWHRRPGAFERLTPPWQPVRLVHTDGVREGGRAVLELGPAPFSVEWVAEHYDVRPGHGFSDRQVRGPFRSWRHAHRMEPAGPDACLLRDDVAYSLPLAGALLGGFARPQLKRLFAYRHRITAQDLGLHARYAAAGPRRFAISGSSGLIGSALTALLTSGGHTVVRLRRDGVGLGPDDAYWNPFTGEVDLASLEGLDAVIHLAGENPFSPRWTDRKKRAIKDSRVRGTMMLAGALTRLRRPPAVFISASAIGYYGSRGDERLDETSAPAEEGFLPEVVRAWEAAALPATDAGIRTVQARIGLVLTPAGGILQLMLPPFYLGLGGSLVGPRQWASWIALDDVIGALYHLALDPEASGPVNLVAPEPVTLDAFTATLAGVLERPRALHVPADWLRTAMGEVAENTILASARVEPARLEASGYSFLHPDLEGALRHLLGR